MPKLIKYYVPILVVYLILGHNFNHFDTRRSSRTFDGAKKNII